MWCRHERCKIIELHEAHDHDFARVRSDRGRLPAQETKPRVQTKAERLVAFKPPLYRDLITCPECKGRGVGCEPCSEEGELLYIQWLRWRSNC